MTISSWGHTLSFECWSHNIKWCKCPVHKTFSLNFSQINPVATKQAIYTYRKSHCPDEEIHIHKTGPNILKLIKSWIKLWHTFWTAFDA